MELYYSSTEDGSTNISLFVINLENGNKNLLEEVGPEFERTLISVALNKTKGKKKEAAELLGWGRNTLSRKIKELGIEN